MVREVMLSRSASVSDSHQSPPPALQDTPVLQLLSCHPAALVCILFALHLHKVMSSRHKKGRPAPSHNRIQRPQRKTRSISLSAELECSGQSSSSRGGFSAARRSARQQRLGEERSRTVSRISATEGVESYLLSCSPMLSMGKALTTLKLQPPKAFPIQQLPVDCMLKIFSFLNPVERGQAAQVCGQWSQLMRSSSLWSNVDLTVFPLCTSKTACHQCTDDCYKAYKARMRKFIKYLVSVKPVLRSLVFAYDIAEYKDGWLECLQGLIKASRCLELEMASLNWKETPIRPYWSESITWSTNDYNELMHRHRHRQRLFVNFFDLFTAAAPYVRQLVLPFDWSTRSLVALTRLKHLENLVLEKYFVFQNLEQDSLDNLLKQLPNLKRLILEVWTPSGRGLILFSLHSASLKYLDVSQCRGFYIKSVNLPKVTVFKISRHPWNGPLTSADQINMPCIYEVLCEGAPNLRQLNEHMLRNDWRSNSYEELDVVLKAICSCRVHKSGWVM